MNRSLIAVAMASGALAALFACSKTPVGPTTCTQPTVPTTVTANGGSGSTLQVNSSVQPRPSVTVTGCAGPLNNVQVLFRVRPGRGAVTDSVVVTGASGLATVGSWTVGPTPGVDTLFAIVGNLTPAIFRATVIAQPAGPPSSVTAAAGATPQQTVPVATDVPVKPRVLVKDSAGVPVIGARVDFSVGTGNGTLLGGVQFTGGDGTATPDKWTTDVKPGRDTLVAKVGTLPAVNFVVDVVAGAPKTITKTAGDSQTVAGNTQVPVLPQVQLLDSLGNGVPGVVVVYAVASGGGSVTGANAVTDTLGRASPLSWKFGPSGAQSLTATAQLPAGVPALPVRTFTGSAVTLVVAAAGDSQAAPILSTLPTAPAIKVTNAQGVVQAGVAVTFSVASGGGTITGTTTTTNGSGIATLGSWLLGGVRGSQQLTATATGYPPFTFTATGQSTDFSATLVSAGGFALNTGTAGTTGVGHGCALTLSGALRCWGANALGQLGVGAVDTFRLTPTVASVPPLTSLAAGDGATCGLTAAGALYCWGRVAPSGGINLFGDAGQSGNVSAPALVQSSRSYKQVALGKTHACGIDAATSLVRCWGDNTYGQVGDNTGGAGVVRNTPTAINSALTFAKVGAGDAFSCGLTTGGLVYCWGRGFRGQLGSGATDSVFTPQALTGVAGLTFSDLSVGEVHACAVTTTAQVLCWGDNTYGQLGSGQLPTAQPFASTPQQVPGGLSFSAVSAGSVHTCALQGSGIASCWGSNSLNGVTIGVTGTGTSTVGPSQVSTRFFQSIEAGALHTCAVERTTNALFCWGYNASGQVGEPSYRGIGGGLPLAAQSPVRVVTPGATAAP